MELLRIAYYPDAADVNETQRRNIALLSDANFVYGVIKAVILQTEANNRGSDNSQHKNTHLFRWQPNWFGLNFTNKMTRVINDLQLHFTPTDFPYTPNWTNILPMVEFVMVTMLLIFFSKSFQFLPVQNKKTDSVLLSFLQIQHQFEKPKVRTTFPIQRFGVRGYNAKRKNDNELCSHRVSVYFVLREWLKIDHEIPNVSYSNPLAIHQSKEQHRSNRASRPMKFTARKLQTTHGQI